MENYFGKIIPQYEPDDFRSHFQLTRQSFDDLAQKISKCDEYNIKILTCDDIIMLQYIKSQVNIIMLHVDIIYLACREEKYVIITVIQVVSYVCHTYPPY